MKYEVNEIRWDEGSEEHIWKHRVYAWEVEDVVFDDIEREASLVRSRKHGESLIIKGQTRSGRSLIVSLKPIDPRAGVWRCATAMEIRGR